MIHSPKRSGTKPKQTNSSKVCTVCRKSDDRETLCCITCKRSHHCACVNERKSAKDHWECAPCKFALPRQPVVTKTGNPQISIPTTELSQSVMNFFKGNNIPIDTSHKQVGETPHIVEKAKEPEMNLHRSKGFDGATSGILNPKHHSSPIHGKSQTNRNNSMLLETIIQEEELLRKEQELIKRQKELLRRKREVLESMDSDEISSPSEDEGEEERPPHPPATETNPPSQSPICYYVNSAPRDLPKFTGNPEDWPIFISAFKVSTQQLKMSPYDNLLRLQKALGGTALEMVKCLLYLPENVDEVINTLRELFGRPEQLMMSQIEQVRREPGPKLERLAPNEQMR